MCLRFPGERANTHVRIYNRASYLRRYETSEKSRSRRGRGEAAHWGCSKRFLNREREIGAYIPDECRSDAQQ